MNRDAVCNVLVIDDDVGMQANLCDILELDGYHVERAATLREALDRVNWSDVSIIVLARNFSGEPLDALVCRAREHAPDATVILTGSSDLNEPLAAFGQGAPARPANVLDPAKLRATVARVAKLNEAGAKAAQRERLAAIGHQMTVLAHESRNALQLTRNGLSLLSQMSQDRPEVLDVIARIQKAQGALQHLLNEVQGYAAPVSVLREVTDLRLIWRRAWESLAAERLGRVARLREETRGVDLFCAVDPFRLEQVFRNLLENALAACPDPVQIEVLCSEAELPDISAVCVAVRDNGPGIDPKQKQRVFDPFYTTRSNGTGLGLAISKRIVQAHGGEIVVGGGGRPGAEFVILLPRAASARPTPRPPEVPLLPSEEQWHEGLEGWRREVVASA